MIFNSLTYLCTICLVTCLYWFLPNKSRILMLCLSNIIFYSFWRFEFVFLIIFSAITDYYISLKMNNVSFLNRKRMLYLSLFINLGILFYFKYIIFFQENVINFAYFFGINLDQIFVNIILPLGISFYTFQSISYIIDVYNKNILPEKSFLNYFCYLTFFPQLVAGPILRASEVIHQFVQKTRFNIDYIFSGFQRIFYGLFLKVVLADNIAPLVDEGFASSTNQLFALDVWTLSFLFGFQIYFDFSAYSHIAIGSAILLGIYFPENFNFPYLATSPREFWKKWHISLSSWIRDYLYLPLLGLKRISKSSGGIDTTKTSKKSNMILISTWGIMGFWHGASWNFFIWGVYHSFLILIYRFAYSLNLNINKFYQNLVGIFVTLPLIMLGWIPFRSTSVDQTFEMWSKIFNPYSYFKLGLRENTYLITFLILIGILSFKIIRNPKIQYHFEIRYLSFFIDIMKWIVIFALTFIFFEQGEQFIYFQF